MGKILSFITSPKVLKTISMTTTVLSLAAGAAGSWAQSKQTEQMIVDESAKAAKNAVDAYIAGNES